jgi:hypothetical protein
MPTFLDYEIVPEDNESGTVPTRFPEGNFKGTWVNLCFRHMAAVIRDLGSRTAKLPRDENDNIVAPNNGRVGTLAFQNSDDVDITGGVLTTVRGGMPLGSIISIDNTWAEYVDRYELLFRAGWVVCDGRTVTNPYTNASVTLPDLRGRYLRMFVQTAGAGNNFGATTQTTTEAGARAAGTTGGTALTAANLPALTVTAPTAEVESGDPAQRVTSVSVSYTGSATHTHSVPAIPDHTHVVDMQPLSVNVIYLKRVW